MARIWHPGLGFTVPGAQPAWVSLRLQVPSRDARVRPEAFDGLVAVRLRGAIGDKLKRIPRFIGATELDNLDPSGDVDIDNLAGLSEIRPSVAPERAASTAPLLVKARGATPAKVVRAPPRYRSVSDNKEEK